MTLLRNNAAEVIIKMESSKGLRVPTGRMRTSWLFHKRTRDYGDLNKSSYLAVSLGLKIGTY